MELYQTIGYINMTREDCEKFKRALESRGYKWEISHSTDEFDFSCYKSVLSGIEDRNHVISFRFYDFTPFIDRCEDLKDNPFGVEVSILANREENPPSYMSISGEINIDKIEKIARDFFKLCETNNLT